MDWAKQQQTDAPRRAVHVRLSFPGANPSPRLEPLNRLDTVVSYFIGSTPEEWHPDVPVWGGVRYRDVYRALTSNSRGGMASGPGGG